MPTSPLTFWTPTIEASSQLEEQLRTTVQPPTMSTPYELMIADIKRQLMTELKTSLPNEGKIREIITSEVNRLGKHTVVIEDRRKSPVEITEIKEAVHQSMPDLLGILNANCWAAIVGPTGSGKTLGVLQCARLLNISIVCIKQMTRIIAPHDLIGYMDANGHYRKGAWTDAILGKVYINNCQQPSGSIDADATTAIIVVDEMDNANENVIMIIKALQTGKIAMPYGMQEVNPRLLVIATMNTWGNGATREYVGRCAQDAALLNEFQFIEWNYDTKFEWELLQQTFSSYKETGDYELAHMRTLLDMFIAMRTKAEQQKVRVIISTRNIINVCKLLLSNSTWVIHKALTISVYKGLKDEEVKRIECPEMWITPKKKEKLMQKQVEQENKAQQRLDELKQKYPKTTKDGDGGEECPI